MNNRHSLKGAALTGLMLCLLTTACSEKSPWDKSMSAGEAAVKKAHYSEAEKAFAQACEDAQMETDDKHLSVSLNALAKTYIDEKNRYTEAEVPAKRALALREKTPAPNQADLAESLNTLVEVYLCQLVHGFEDGHLINFDDRRKDVESLLKRAMAIGEKPGSDQLIYADTLTLQGKLFGSIAYFKKEKPLLEQALAIREKLRGAESPEVAETLRDLAEVESKLVDQNAQPETRKKELQQVADLYERALKIQERALAKPHPDLAKTLAGLGLICQEQKDYKKADENFKRAKSIDEMTAKYGGQDSNASNDLVNLYREYDQNTLLKPFSVDGYKYVPEVSGGSPKGFQLLKGDKVILERKLAREYPYDYANISVVFPLAKACLTKKLDLLSRWGGTSKLDGDCLTRLPAINHVLGVADPCIIVGTFSGGMNSCCTDYEIFSLNDKATKILGLEDRNVYDFTFGDFHENGQLYAIGQDMTWAYWNASMADSTLPGVVLYYTPNRWKLSISDMKVDTIPAEQIAKALEHCRAGRAAVEKEYPPDENVFAITSDVWTAMLNMIYAGHSNDAWSFLDQVWPKDKAFCTITSEDGHYLNKDTFKKSIKDQLRKSPNFSDLVFLNEGQEL